MARPLMLLPITSVPQLSHVDASVFRLRYFGRCMACDFCADACCAHGCDVNLGERERILAVKDELVPLVAAPPERWFDDEIEEDPEVPTGKVVRANSENGACVFKRKNGRGCAIHALATATGRDYHQLKPMVCWLFPVSWDQRVLKPSDDVGNGLICAGGGMTLYEAARDELRVVFGDGLIGELDALSKQLQAA